MTVYGTTQQLQDRAKPTSGYTLASATVQAGAERPGGSVLRRVGAPAAARPRRGVTRRGAIAGDPLCRGQLHFRATQQPGSGVAPPDAPYRMPLSQVIATRV